MQHNSRPWDPRATVTLGSDGDKRGGKQNHLCHGKYQKMNTLKVGNAACLLNQCVLSNKQSSVKKPSSPLKGLRNLSSVEFEIPAKC